VARTPLRLISGLAALRDTALIWFCAYIAAFQYLPAYSCAASNAVRGICAAPERITRLLPRVRRRLPLRCARGARKIACSGSCRSRCERLIAGLPVEW